MRRKRFLNNIIPLSAVILSGLLLQACSTNPATGKQQFTALMSPQQENTIGAQEHEKIIKQYGQYENAKINNYVREIGSRVTQKTERPDVQYKFYVLDSPIVNAFALPGGYIYISRGLLALANNEAQVAAVLSHEAGHITGRHSAERYSRGVVTSLGAGVLGAVIGSQEAAQALGVGSNLYLSSYSRTQENEADTLGIRYMTQGGYDPDEMAAFLSALQAQSGLDARLAGREANTGVNYFSTHPATGDRVRKTSAEAKAYKDSNVKRRDEYLRKIDGMIYGDSAEQGFTRGQTFYHPKIGFSFKAPNGYRFVNQTNQIIVTANNGAVVLFDMTKRASGQSASSYIQQKWLKNKPGLSVEKITVNGMKGATTSFDGAVNGKPVTLRAMAIEFKPGTFVRFQVAIPKNASSSMIDDLKRTTYSFKRMTDSEKNKIKPYRLRVVNAKKGDTIASLANRLPYEDRKEERFRVLNSLLPNESLVAGRPYKIITD